MMSFVREYINILCYLICSITIATLMVLLAKFFAPSKSDAEKLSAYECGFEPFTNARIKFDVTFSIIAILYLIFDLEIVLLVPWVINAAKLGFFSFVVVLIFLLTLMAAFVIEWLLGALKWRRSE